MSSDQNPMLVGYIGDCTSQDSLECHWWVLITAHSVDGRNPAPPDMYETPQIMRYLPYQAISRISSINQWIILVLVKGGRDYITL